MLQVIQAILPLLAAIAPTAPVGVAGQIISALATLAPIAMQEAKDVLPSIKNIITGLRSNGEVTKEQLDQLDSIEAVIDANFDDAAAAAAAADEAAGQG